jgi:cysteine desulfurase
MIYLDNAASTPPHPAVLEAVQRAALECFANPSSAHAGGAAAARALEEARAEIAALVRGQAPEVLFTSGGTEANALALLGVAARARGRHMIIGALEHPAVRRNAERLVEAGWELTTVPARPDGVIDLEAFKQALRPDTALVAIMLVNNELGTLQPIGEVAAALRASGVRAHLHVDAVQSAGLVPMDVRTLGADTLALSAHKMHGPKGVGALWVKNGTRLTALWDGGRQERALRSGTENVPGAVGFARAATLARREAVGPQVQMWRDELEGLLYRELPEARPTVTGPRAPHIASVTLPGLPAEPLLHALEARGVFASAGSACASRTRGPSPALAAVGVAAKDAVLRFSLSRLTRREDLAPAVDALQAAVAEVREVTLLQRRA